MGKNTPSAPRPMEEEMKLNVKNPTLRSIWRTKWLLVMLIILGLIFYFLAPPNTTMRLVTYKLFIGICALVVGHVAVKSLYDYISLSQLLDRNKFNEMPDAIKFLGACFLRGLVLAAFVIGVLLGI
jgi:hypothetical protein